MTALSARRIAVPGWAGPAAGIAAVLACWEVLALTVFAGGHAVPTPQGVLRTLADDGWSFYGPHLRGTGGEALRGFLWGNAIATALALLVVLVPPLERVVTQLAVASYCLPIIAVGPILTVVFDGDTPMVALSALSVVFTTLIGMLAGLRAADPAGLDLVRAYGGGRWAMLRRVRFAAALPAAFTALKISAPAAVLGAIIGEFMGRVPAGLGLAMIVAQQQLDVERTWGVAIVSGALAGVAYAGIALAGRLVTPWAPRGEGR
ncbi:alkanesulfonate transporter permease subunit [Actinomadura rubteroloni]|uniref:Alkanesulfonate transporter permease subunit n=1 Tax=Actinomadura rubteroloni TaxID=1926885 RepID=A0A2P4UEF9_9ACTN|nr:ABC transporter permease subunit [Actinomadura rubteroloni]POM23447.1 alkanesulfonate transporter permease subunit [Actinomadura rubteroloni]